MQATSLPAAPRAATARAPRVLAGAVILGVVTQVLFFRTGLGLDWLIWDLMLIAVTYRTLARGALRAPAIAVGVLAALLGAAFVLHRSDFTTAITLPLNLVALAALPVIVADDMSVLDLQDLPLRLITTSFRIPFAIFVTVLLPRDALVELDGEGRSVARRSIAGLALGLPIAGVFTALLSADAGFASVVDHASMKLDTAISFAVQAGITATLFAFAHGLFANRVDHPFQPVETLGAPYRALEPTPKTARLSTLTWGIVLAQVAAVFLVYAFVHRDTEFGGHEVVHGRNAITYASNLHAGFAQLLLATVASVGLVVIGHALLTNDEAKVPGGASLIALEGALLLLTGVALYSCAHRLAIYQEAYGASLLRLGVAFVVLGASVVLLTTLIKSSFRGFRFYVPLTMAGMSAVALTAAFMNADAWVAEKNLNRMATEHAGSTYVDFAYLATLSADACAVVDHVVLKGNPSVRDELIRAWTAKASVRDVRAFRGITRCPSVQGP